MKKFIAMSLAAATMSFASTGAQALTLSLTQAPTLWNASNPQGTVNNNGSAISGGATFAIGPQKLTGTLGIDPVVLFAYCIDLYQGAAQDNFSVVSLMDYLSDVRPGDALARYDMYAKLVSAHLGPVSAQVDGAIQAAVWELRYELSGNPLSVYAGSTNMAFSNTNGAFTPNTFLSNIPGTAINPNLNLFVAKSNTSQDFLFWTVTSVPEPTTWAMMIVGMAAVGYAMRSGRRSTNISFA